ncbi:MAG: uroporphyrinogen-III C-methyltransferase [Myxococcota bacterium]|nr:uroporphyrinogen-III C-methyltransferase [Myxococcota bacterium]
MPLGFVSLVGAGPGDPELITERGLRRLAEADVVVHDALVHPALLARARPGAEIRFAGKRAGQPSIRQQAIHDALIEAARRGLRVVRLKGGDPFLFGRGSEEAEALAAAGIPFEVVPGVSSLTAVPAYAGISPTHRTLSASFAVVAATESAERDGSAHDWARLATATDTIVLFMGLGRLEQTARRLVEHGRPASTPVAVISQGTLPAQRVLVATLGDVAERTAQADLRTPALVLVGEVVRLREHIAWYERLPLFGWRVLVTRPEGQTESLVRALRDAGAEPIEWPAIRIAPPQDPAPLERAVANVARYDWIVFTSRNGVERFFAELARQGADARRLGHARLAVIGPGTAAALEAQRLRADLVAPKHVGEALAEALVQTGSMCGARVLVPRAAVARDVLPEALRAAGAEVDVVHAYRSLPPDEAAAARLRALLSGGALDAVLFTASSTVQHTVQALGPDAASLLAPLRVVSIGPVTTDRALRSGIRVDATADPHTADGLLDALRRLRYGQPP